MDAKQSKLYLTVAGTFLPAFSGLAVLSIVRKEHKLDKTAILVFGGLAVAGGYLTAKIMNKTGV